MLQGADPRCCPAEALLVEFPYDTKRALVSLLLSGSFAKFREIRWIFCHCGDVVPVLSGRMRKCPQKSPPDSRHGL